MTMATTILMKQVGEFIEKGLAGVNAFMKRLDDNALIKKITAPWMEGEHELGDFEQTHHLGEIIAMLWQSNIQLPGMTWIMNTQ
jgi:hypothetical protein